MPRWLQILALHYFGNEHVRIPMDVKVFKAAWQEFFHILNSGYIHWQRVVFFMGGLKKFDKTGKTLKAPCL